MSQTARRAQVGIQGKKGLLLTPGLYEVGEPIMVTDPGFVILGLGFPTLVSKARGGLNWRVLGRLFWWLVWQRSIRR